MPLADATLFPVPSDIPRELLVLMTDILPTGYSTAMNARRLADEDRIPFGTEAAGGGGTDKKGICVVVGCGPVRLNTSEGMFRS